MEIGQEKSKVMAKVAGYGVDGAWLRVFKARGKHDKAFRQLGETVQVYAKLEKELRRAKRIGGRPCPNLRGIKEEVDETLKRISREKREVTLATRDEWEAGDALFEARKRYEKVKRHLLKVE